MKLLIKNIKGIVGAREEKPGLLSGAAMKEMPMLENAWLAVEDGIIVDFGLMENWGGITDWRDLEVTDADGKYLFPGWCDSHTHLVYAGNREGEFVDRIKGLTYAEIAENGGGILNSAMKLASASEDELFEAAMKRADRVIRMGTTAIEIKSGYGLTVAAELKMLRVIKRLKEALPIPVKSTFLGAHAFPKEYKENPDGYIDLIINEMLPQIAEEKLADYVDAFLEDGYFSIPQVTRILEAAAAYGLKGKVHVNQFTANGGVKACVDLGCISVDHLEELTDADVQALKGGSTIPVALPSCSLFLTIPYTPARMIIDAGLPLALATDFNPGSTPSGNMNLVVALACFKMKMLPEEAFNAATINGAAAMELEEEIGSITPGMRANFFLTEAINSPYFIPYSFGDTLVDEVYVDGKKYEGLTL
ncbi:MAG: imidazolonepropionase [Flavobacteriales bacterium]|nr:imidazolonepropionase [Flavobacteriales bacterium]MDG1780681.1 imidazolonepropionase [Flavobacteriales bacterium]